MALNDLYTPFSDRQQAEYEKWLINEYGPDMAASIATSKAAVEQLPDGMAGAMNRFEGHRDPGWSRHMRPAWHRRRMTTTRCWSSTGP